MIRDEYGYEYDDDLLDEFEPWDDDFYDLWED